MRRTIQIALICVALVLYFQESPLSQSIDSLEQRAKEVNEILDNRKSNDFKIETPLFYYMKKYKKDLSNGLSKQMAIKRILNETSLRPDNLGRPFVMIKIADGHAADSYTIQSLIKNSGGIINKVLQINGGYIYIYAWVNIETISDISANQSTIFIETPGQMFPRGSITTP